MIKKVTQLIGDEVESPVKNLTQVYKATHDKEGNRLPFMYRSFISFTYGGRYIEDFGLIVITENNSIQRDLYPEVKNIVTDPEPVDGQFYWGTHYSARKLHLALFTDEVTEDQLDDFKHWFQPGIVRELILSQNPFRGIMARIDENITMGMLPFEKKIKTKMAGKEYETSITSYKGKIDLTFVMDDPLWYSLFNVLDYQTDEAFGIGVWRSFNEGRPEEIAKSKDAIKILYEDRIPTLEMFNYSAIDNITIDVKNYSGIKGYIERGDGNISAAGFSESEQPITLVDYKARENEYAEGQMLGSRIAFDENEIAIDDSKKDTARISGGYQEGLYIDQGWVGLRKIDKRTHGLSLATTTGDIPPEYGKKYIYYAGTAPSYPILNFSIDKLSTTSNGYIKSIGNSYIEGDGYSSFFIRGKKINEMRITTPGIMTAYNQAIAISHQQFSDILSLKDAITNGINHYKIRAMAISVIGEKTSVESAGSLIRSAINGLLLCKFTFKINCKTGKVTMTTTGGDSFYNGEEDAGDMILSNYLKIDERNHFNDNGYVDIWENNPEYSQIFYHNLNATVSDVILEYHYMYF